MELAALQSPGLVARHSFTNYVKVAFLPRHIAASSPTGGVQERGHAHPRYPWGRPARRSSGSPLGWSKRAFCPV